MKLTVNFGDELKHAKIIHREKIPVYNNFDNSKLIGEAELLHDGTAEISLIETYSEKVEALYESFRKEVNFIETDLNTSIEMKKAVEFVKRM